MHNTEELYANLGAAVVVTEYSDEVSHSQQTYNINKQTTDNICYLLTASRGKCHQPVYIH